MSLQPKRVLIVGGGPCGLVTLRNCLHRGTFSEVQLVERQGDVGGVWYQRRSHVPTEDYRPRWSTPAYPELIGNVLPEFLSFSEHPFPVPPSSPFPTFAETSAYLKAFALPFVERGHIRLSHEVIGVEENDGGGWVVRMKDWNKGGGAVLEETWDAVVITTVWFDNPYFPEVEGLEELQHQQPSKVQHSITWTGPHEGYEGKRVLVVGNANSANEMSAQLAPIARTPVYRSTRRVSIFPSLPDARIQDIGPITRYSTSTSDKNKITAHQDESTIEDIDIVLFGTGYYPDVPYLRVVHPKSRTLAPLTSRTITPSRIPSLHLQVLYAHNPTLAFIGGTISFIPFLLADLTSTWLALAWSGTIPVPRTSEERLVYERDRLDALARQRAETDNPSNLVNFHFLGRDELSYAQGIRNDIIGMRPSSGLDEVLAKWDDGQDTRRWAMYAAKLDSLHTQNGMK
ncbi:FAD/NAD(P)-binding domain-containing protein [Rhizopogon vinicolor AM-OR11-026]|uniref:FAD/NAD(P)-binding domain-containing protein n=1 Tax=Rhizopogon vinicolor AM-OR11-026 TaxID=1314800 RepID=A0A1B7MYJ3_9AGAM|nr:FAD/NAD(P)-binding domain-containing protein [Rhizopogon vinicolor AM-OR11-026]